MKYNWFNEEKYVRFEKEIWKDVERFGESIDKKRKWRNLKVGKVIGKFIVY